MTYRKCIYRQVAGKNFRNFIVKDFLKSLNCFFRIDRHGVQFSSL